jgi:membrane fusion protein, multidrug efflux system
MERTRCIELAGQGSWGEGTNGAADRVAVPVRCGVLGVLVVGMLLVVLLGAWGCERRAPAFVPPPPPEVTVAVPAKKTVPVTLEFTGTTRAKESVEIRARVRGFLQKKHVEGGRRVKTGDLLFTIDPREFDAAVKQAKANVESRAAALKLAQLTLDRTRDAASRGAANASEIDRAEAERDAADAQMELAEAQLDRATLDLEFTNIKAPINGRLGFIPIDEGQLVGATEPTLLTTIVNDEIVYAAYDIDERTLLRLRQESEYRRPGEDGRPNLVVRMGMANDTGFPIVGAFDKADSVVNAQTGTIRIESIFENPNGRILAGQFVRLQAMFGERESLLLPDVAVQSDQGGRYVLVLNEKDVVERRNITVGPVIDRMRPIETGLDGNERVIVNGLQRVRPGMPVKPIEAAAKPTESTPAQPTPAQGKAGG